jgi:glycosyltransferase involved in cell wall biosynthesis
MRVLWLIVGPADHGVVILAEQLMHGLKAPVVLRAADHADVRTQLDRFAAEVDVAHVHFTDQLFGANCDAAARAYTELAAQLGERGARLGVTLHDLPVASDDPHRYRRRTQAYAAVVAATTAAVIVSSAHEVELLTAFCPDVRPVVIPLPIDAATAGRTEAIASCADVTVFGYLYPGKGHQAALEALAALAPEVGLTVLGRVADGHADLADDLRRRAAELGRRVTITGWLEDGEVQPRLQAAGIPLVGHERMSASGSIGSWLSAGRRPLVPDVPYVRELAERCPGAVTIYPPSMGGLSAALARAAADPARTWLAPDVVLGPSSDAVAAAYRDAVSAEPSR